MKNLEYLKEISTVGQILINKKSDLLDPKMTVINLVFDFTNTLQTVKALSSPSRLVQTTDNWQSFVFWSHSSTFGYYYLNTMLWLGLVLIGVIRYGIMARAGLNTWTRK